jgi:cytidine deaminase
MKYENSTLLQEARSVAKNAYTLSGFRVGAAVIANGKTFVGVNVENASLGLSICAERVALASAVSAGCRDIEAIAVACVDAPRNGKLEERVPCGACRQWLVELAPTAKIIIDGTDRVFKIDDLLPIPFRFGKSTI